MLGLPENFPFILHSWASNWATKLLGLALCASHNETGIEDGDEGNIPSPASPNGTPFGMLSRRRG